MRWNRWSKGDQVGLEGLLYAVVGLGAVSVVPRLAGAVRGEPIPLTSELPEELVRPAAGVEGPLTGTVVLEDPSAGHQLLALVPPLLTVLLIATGAALLLGVVRALRAGDPFTPASARRLTWLALLLAIGGPVLQLVDDLVRSALLSQVATASHLPSTFTLSLWPLAAGLVVAFVAEVFTRGTALRAEVEGLV